MQKVIATLLASLLLFRAEGFGQDSKINAASRIGSDRGGFTFNIDMGLGIQSDAAIEESAIGLSGLNFGLGGWATDQLAIMFRISGTSVSYDVRKSSAVFAPVIQFWPSPRGFVEAGVGFGFWEIRKFQRDDGLGMVVGTGFSILNRGKHNLTLGVEYTPAFTEHTVHNFGINFGYQLW